MSKRPLVQRLRENPNFAFWLDIAEAADRIEELEAEVKRFQQLEAEIEELRQEYDDMERVKDAEIEQLREAIQNATTYGEVSFLGVNIPFEAFNSLKKALEDGK